MLHVLAVAGMMVAPTGLALAEDAVAHYEARKVADLGEAYKVFAIEQAKIGALLAQDTLSGADLELVHQISYTVENAVAVYGKAGIMDKATFKAFADAVEDIHKASEHHEPAKLRAAYATFQSLLAQ